MILNLPKQREFLKKTVELGRVPHALLFCGQNASGKKALAIEFIKTLNCQAASLAKRPCQRCRTCQEIEKKTNPDLSVVEPLENQEIKISQIRQLQSHLALRAYSAPFKAVIIDKAHCLNQEAQSAFLKLLEEPKGRTVFILISQYPEMLLPTILSRVERMSFPVVRINSQATEKQKKIISDMLKVKEQEMTFRFQYAKKLAEEPEQLKDVLETWLVYFREMLISTVNSASQTKEYSLTKLSKIIKLIQTTDFLIATTNVSPRLALEILMLEL